MTYVSFKQSTKEASLRWYLEGLECQVAPSARRCGLSVRFNQADLVVQIQVVSST